jgi:hypothetical protein
VEGLKHTPGKNLFQEFVKRKIIGKGRVGGRESRLKQERGFAILAAIHKLFLEGGDDGKGDS